MRPLSTRCALEPAARTCRLATHLAQLAPRIVAACPCDPDAGALARASARGALHPALSSRSPRSPRSPRSAPPPRTQPAVETEPETKTDTVSAAGAVYHSIGTTAQPATARTTAALTTTTRSSQEFSMRELWDIIKRNTDENTAKINALSIQAGAPVRLPLHVALPLEPCVGAVAPHACVARGEEPWQLSQAPSVRCACVPLCHVSPRPRRPDQSDPPG